VKKITNGSDSPERRRRKVRRRLADEEIAAQRKKRRHMQIGCGAGALAVVGLVVWLGYEVLQAKSNLEKAQGFATQAKSALLAGDTDKARVLAGDADRYAQGAQGSVDSTPWRIAGVVPLLGSPFDSTRQMTTIVSGLTRDVLLPTVAAGSALSPNQLVLEGARINLAALQDAAPVLESTAASATDLNTQAESIDSTYIGLIDDARIDLQNQVSELTEMLHNASTTAKIAPRMLGADGPRNYFIGFQTNAEARGTGGLLGGYGVAQAVDGALKISELSSNRDLYGQYEPLDLGPDFDALYGHSRPTTFFGNSNVSSHFPYAAKIWRSIWAQDSGQVVDGVIATDTVALSYILEAIGPIVMPDGERVTAENVVELTQSVAYSRFADNNTARRQYLQEVGKRAIEKMTQDISNPVGVLAALGRATTEGRLAVWSANPDEQTVLADTKLGHTVPDDSAPFAGVVINNLGGNKMDYYLRREITYRADTCEGSTRNSTVTVRLSNAVPNHELPDYVAANFADRLAVPKGTNYTDLGLLATQEAKLRKVTVNGKPTFSFHGTERNHPVFSVQFPILPGETAEVVFELTEPNASGHPRVPIQPLIDDPVVEVEVPECPDPADGY
jgi:hypothetical protein